MQWNRMDQETKFNCAEVPTTAVRAAVLLRTRCSLVPWTEKPCMRFEALPSCQLSSHLPRLTPATLSSTRPPMHKLLLLITFLPHSLLVLFQVTREACCPVLLPAPSSVTDWGRMRGFTLQSWQLLWEDSQGELALPGQPSAWGRRQRHWVSESLCLYNCFVPCQLKTPGQGHELGPVGQPAARCRTSKRNPLAPPLHCTVVAPQSLVTSESHQPAAKQAELDNSNTGKVLIKDPKAILQTFSLWTARVRCTIETARPPLFTGSLSDEGHSPTRCPSQSTCNLLTQKGSHSVVSRPRWTHQHRFTDILAGFTRRPHDICAFPSSSVRFRGDAESFFPSRIIHLIRWKRLKPLCAAGWWSHTQQWRTGLV